MKKIYHRITSNWINYRLLNVLIVVLGISNSIHAQSCQGEIIGIVTDEYELPIPGAIITIEDEISRMQYSDKNGEFAFRELCPGDYTISIKILGYIHNPEIISLTEGTIELKIIMTEDIYNLPDIEIIASRPNLIATLNQTTLSKKELMRLSGGSLGNQLKHISGVDALQTGPTIAKPVIHGLTGNRILIINDGVRLEGQQWGYDHAPEIDPFRAGEISVIKGAASIRYGADAIAGVVVLDAPTISLKPGVRGDISIVGASNGRKGGLSGSLEGAFGNKLKGLGWRVQGTVQRAGNMKTPNYYLANTGFSETNYSADLIYKKKNSELSASYNQYNSKLGVYWGAEVGDTNDLKAAFEQREAPLVPNYFTYKINEGYQNIKNGIFKLSGKHRFKNNHQLEVTYSFQHNLRQEFSQDIAFSSNNSTADLPENEFKLQTQTVDILYKPKRKKGFSTQLGISGNTKSNIYSGTGWKPLIPNYRDYGGGAFAIGDYTIGRWMVEAGVRYDYLWRQFYQFNTSTLKNYESTFEYHNATGTLGAKFAINEWLNLNANFGTGWRAPSPNEMYMNGIHASAAQFVIGDSTLSSERSYNSTLSISYQNKKLWVEIGMFNNEISNFIYANPIGPVQVTGVGYNAFQFVQDDVRLLGADISIKWDVIKNLTFDSKTTLLKATNKTRKGGLVNMPPTKLQNGLTVHFVGFGKIDKPYFTIENITVLKQNYILKEQEQTLPPAPPTYSLFNLSTGFSLPLNETKLDFNFSVENLTNLVYSNYMNQFRYFAYELGINFILRVKYTF